VGAPSARRFAHGAIAFLTIVACDEAPSPPRGGVGKPASPTTTPSPTPTPIPTRVPTPTPILVWDDLAFQKRTGELCDSARPKSLYDTGPYRPPENAPDYDGVHIVVLEEGSAMIDFVEVFCAADGTVALPRRVAANVPLSLGEFETASADVSVVGEFVGSGAVAGTIRALPGSATACGIPDQDAWSAFLDLDVVPAGAGYVASVRPDL
jgi:hypothetical protein